MGQQTENVIEIFSKLELFADLDERGLLELSNIVTRKEYKQGEVIFEEDSIGDSMMIIIGGEVRVSQTQGVSSEEALVVLKKGDFFGEMAALEALPRTATAIAHTDAVILEMSREHFMHFIEADNKSGIRILVKLAQILSARLREADKKLKTFQDLTKWI